MLPTRSARERRRPTAQELVPPAVLQSSAMPRSVATTRKAAVRLKAFAWPALAAAQNAARFAAAKQERKGCRIFGVPFISSNHVDYYTIFFPSCLCFLRIYIHETKSVKILPLFRERWKQP